MAALAGDEQDRGGQRFDGIIVALGASAGGLEAGRVYVIPQDTVMTVSDSRLRRMLSSTMRIDS